MTKADLLALAAVAALIGGFAWRIRGGAWETLLRLPGSSQAGRAVAAVGVVAIAGFLSPLAWALAPAVFLGLVLAGWGRVMDIGRVDGKQAAEAFGMAAQGALTMAPTFVLMPFLGFEPLATFFAGLSFGAIYAAAWHTERRWPKLKRFAAGPTEWAEVLCGVAVALGILIDVARAA